MDSNVRQLKTEGPTWPWGRHQWVKKALNNVLKNILYMPDYVEYLSE
jgi:hypothetical protein